MERGDVRQWRFRGAGTQVRPGNPVMLFNDAIGIELGAVGRTCEVAVGESSPGSARAVTLYRSGSSPDPVRGGERVAVHIEGVGFLAAAPGGSGIATQPAEAAEWIVTGMAPGVAVPVDRPVALFDAVQGDHLVCREDPGGPVLAWSAWSAGPAWSAGTAGTGPVGTGPVGTGTAGMGTAGIGLDGTGPDGSVPLPMSPQFRPPEGVPGDVELSGAMVPIRDGDPSAGLLVLLDCADAGALGTHLVNRIPDRAGTLAPEGSVGAVACRWGPGCGGAFVDVDLPPAGARLWVQGLLVAEPGVCVRPVRVLAWAVDADGESVLDGPDGPQWPALAISWQVLFVPVRCDEASPRPPVAVYLPLPGRDGEPGSTTTFTPARVAGPAGAPGRPGRWATPPAIVRDPRTGRRAVRIGIVPGEPDAVVPGGCTVRVHLPSAPGRA